MNKGLLVGLIAQVIIYNYTRPKIRNHTAVKLREVLLV